MRIAVRIYKWNNFPFLVLFLGMLLLHLTVSYGTVDDSWYLNNIVLKSNGWGVASFFGMDIWSYLMNRYQSWTSGLVIEYA